MNKLIVVLVSFLLVFTSCKKEDIKPNDQVEVIGEEGIVLYGEWKLLDGKMYVENMETGAHTVYDHFDPTKTTSSLRYEGAQFEFETIEQGVTTWEFIAPPNWEGYGEFRLDNDSIQPYGLFIMGGDWSIVEDPTATAATMQLGGSSRPITAVVESYANNIVVFTVQEAYTSINGYNCNYHSELRFQKQ